MTISELEAILNVISDKTVDVVIGHERGSALPIHLASWKPSHHQIRLIYLTGYEEDK